MTFDLLTRIPEIKTVFTTLNGEDSSPLDSLIEKNTKNELILKIFKPGKSTKNKLKNFQIKAIDILIDSAPRQKLNLETKAFTVDNYRELDLNEIKNSIKSGELHSSMIKYSEYSCIGVTAVTAFLPFPLFSFGVKFVQMIEFLERLKYTKMFKGEKLEGVIGGDPQMDFEEIQKYEQRRLLPTQTTAQTQKGTSLYRTKELGFSGVLMIKLGVYLFSWLLKITGLILLKTMISKKVINKLTVQFLKYQRLFSFITFGVFSPELIFQSLRLISVNDDETNSVMFKIMSITVILLVILDISEFVYILKKTKLKTKVHISKKDVEENRKKHTQARNRRRMNFTRNKKKRSSTDGDMTSTKVISKRINIKGKKKQAEIKKKKKSMKVLIEDKTSKRTNRQVTIISQDGSSDSFGESKGFKDPTSLKSYKINLVLQNFMRSGLKPEKTVEHSILCLSINFYFILRLSIYQILVGCMPNKPGIILLFVFLLELTFLVYTSVITCIFRQYKSRIFPMIIIFQTSLMIVLSFFLMIIAFKGQKEDTKPNISNGIQNITIFFWKALLYSETLFLIWQILYVIKQFWRERKQKKKVFLRKQKKENAKKAIGKKHEDDVEDEENTVVESSKKAGSTNKGKKRPRISRKKPSIQIKLSSRIEGRRRRRRKNS